MCIAAIYDIHGNLPALEAVIKDMNKINVTRIIVGGDVIVGPMSSECIEKLNEIKIPIDYIRGNCETEVLMFADNNTTSKLPENVIEDIKWTTEQLLPKHIDLISNWPRNISVLTKDHGEILFCHASPRNEFENFTKLSRTDKFSIIFENVTADVVVCGHTHMQFDKRLGSLRIINAGSVGMPFGKPGAHWLTIGERIEFRHTEYDLHDAVRRILKTNFPSAKTFGNCNLISPPSEDIMLKLFS